MNKSQELDIMQMRAKIQVDELMKQHQALMYGEDPVILGEVTDNKDSEELFNDLEE